MISIKWKHILLEIDIILFIFENMFKFYIGWVWGNRVYKIFIDGFLGVGGLEFLGGRGRALKPNCDPFVL